MSCLCDVECWGDECKQSIARREEAEDTYKTTMAALEAKYLAKPKKLADRKGPSLSMSKAAATALSNTKRPGPADSRPLGKSAGLAKKPTSILPLGKKKPVPLNPCEKRHATAVAASKTTMGYSKGRATSAAMRKTVLPGKENGRSEIVPNYNLAPGLFIKTYGVPRYGTEKWLECQMAGCFDEDKGVDDGLGEAVTAQDDAVARYFQEEAEKDFVLEL